MMPDENGRIADAKEVIYAAHKSSATQELLLTRVRVLIIAFMFCALGLLGASVGVNIGVLLSIHSTQSSNTGTVQQISSDVQTINTNVLNHDLELGEVLGVACLLIENAKTLPVPAACTQQPGPTK